MASEIHGFADADETDGMDDDERALYRRLLADGADWRAGAHSVELLGAQLRHRTQTMSPALATPERLEQAETRAATRGRRAVPHPRASAPTWRRRVAGIGAVAAALLVVGGLAAVLLSAAPGRPRSSPATSEATSTPSSPAEPGKWEDLTKLDYYANFAGNDLPAMAPSDPRVVYETMATAGMGATPLPAQMRRTDDGGATWHQLPLPVAANHIEHAGIAVSPLDARTVFLTIFDDTAADCPANRTQANTEAGGGAVDCWLPYTSTDGGAHWSTTRLPLANGTTTGALTGSVTVGGSTPMNSGALSGQGSRLYAGFRCGDFSCLRLVTSSDGGRSWQFADLPLVTPHGDVCDYTDLPGGSTLFAVTAPMQCSTNSQDPLTLWRSDDAGAHWAALGHLPTPNERAIRLATDTATGKLLLYAMLPRTTAIQTDKMGGTYPTFSSDASDLKVSADGGHTWTAAPSAGLPAGQALFEDTGLASVLPDGSLAALFVPANSTADFSGGTLYTWKPGQSAWRQLAPPISHELGALIVTPTSAGGVGTLWAVLVNRDAQPPSATFMFARDAVSNE